MDDYVRVPLGTIEDGTHFWDPDELFTGSKIVEIRMHKERAGTARVVIYRYKPNRGQLMTSKDYWPLTEMVVPGEMPPEIRAEAEAIRDEILAQRRADSANTAARLAQKGFDIKNIAGQLKVGEAEARKLVQEGVAILANPAPEATPTTGTVNDESLEEVAPQQPPAAQLRAPQGEVKAGRDPQDLVDLKAWTLRCEGKSFREIASRVGYSSTTSARRSAMRGKELSGDG